MPEALQLRIEFVPIKDRNSKMFVAVTLNGCEDWGLFYNTGSSLFSLKTTRKPLARFDRPPPARPTNDKMDDQFVGQRRPMTGAPLKGGLRIARACVADPLVYFESSGLERFGF